MPITAFYAGLLALVLVVLTFRVIGVRRSAKISLGDGQNRDLLARVRTHANFTEYVPMVLILMGLLESIKAPLGFGRLDVQPIVLHAVGTALIAGRRCHAYALSKQPQIMALRVIGMVLTLLSLALAASTCLIFGALKR